MTSDKRSTDKTPAVTPVTAATKAKQALADAVERRQRVTIVNRLMGDYVNSHDDVPTHPDALKAAAAAYINEQLADLGYPWRYDGVADSIVDTDDAAET
jgi:hypothetical protein